MTKKDRQSEQQSEQKTFQSELGGGEFYPDLPRQDFKDIIGNQIEVVDCQLIEDFKSKFGVHDAILILFTDLESGEQFTTITSGEVVIKRLLKAKREDLLPLLGTISLVKDNYYNIL